MTEQAPTETGLPHDARLRTQSGPRTTAPMWASYLMTDGEWKVYTALWSFGDWDGSACIPSHQRLAERARCTRGSAANAIRKFVKLELIVRDRRQRSNGSDASNTYMLIEVMPDSLRAKWAAAVAAHAEVLAEENKTRSKWKKPKRAALAAETTPGDDGTEGPAGGASPSAPPAGRESGEGASGDVPPGPSGDVPPGALPDAPLTYPAFDLSLKDQSPPPATHHEPATTTDPGPAQAGSAAADTAAEGVNTGGKNLELAEKDKDLLNAAVDAALEARPDDARWPKPRIIAAIWEALHAGHPALTVADATVQLAADLHGTAYPARLRPYLDAQRHRQQAATDASNDDRYRHQNLPRNVGRCHRHPDQPAECPLNDHPTQVKPGARDLSPTAAAALAAVRATTKPGKPLTPAGRDRAAAAASSTPELATEPRDGRLAARRAELAAQHPYLDIHEPINA